MYFFSELEKELRIPENLLYKNALDKGMKIISGFGMPGNKFLGFGVSDADAEIILKEGKI